MAFGDGRGASWLALPLAGVVCLLVAWFVPFEQDSVVPGRLFAVGAALLIVGTTLAGLVGHVVWLVPVALLFAFPLLVFEWICERLRDGTRAPRQGQDSPPHDE